MATATIAAPSSAVLIVTSPLGFKTVPAVSEPGEGGGLAGSRSGRGSMVRIRASLERAAVGLKRDLDLVDAQLAQAFE